MSRHSYQPEMRRGTGRFAFSLLGGLLLASQLVFSSPTFALSTRTARSADPPASQSLALSEVSVVRLVFDFTAKAASTGTTAGKPVLCTSLGVLVNSIPATSASNANSWVLTDGSLLNTTPSPCAPSGSSSRGKATTTYALSTITVYANTVYTGTASANALLGTYTAVPGTGFLCSVTPCTDGAFLFAFHTDHLQPTLDMAITDTTQQFGVALTSAPSPTARPPVPLPGTAAAVPFLTPTAVIPGATSNQNEVGMPFINGIGQMTAMNLQGTVMFTAADYHAFVARRSIFTLAPANPLQAAWENGITAYYRQHYQDAITDFQRAESLNPNFTAAKTFELKATALSHSQGSPSGGNPVTATGNATFFGIPRSMFLIIGAAAGFLLLIVFLVIVSVWARRRHELTRWEAERAEAQRNAEKEVQQMQRSKLKQTVYDQPLDKRKEPNINPQSPANSLCPNCGHTVRVGATYCPNCRYQLSPLARGALPTLNMSPVPAMPFIEEKGLAPSAATEQSPVKEAVLDDLAIQATLKRLWDKAS